MSFGAKQDFLITISMGIVVSYININIKYMDVENRENKFNEVGYNTLRIADYIITSAYKDKCKSLITRIDIRIKKKDYNLYAMILDEIINSDDYETFD
jgi:hypothetical protein